MADAERPYLLDHLPPGFLEARARELHRVLPGPTLIELAGRREPPLFVSLLLHGNEDVGLRAVQELLRTHRLDRLPRSLALFVGNVAAAAAGVRRLPDQPDYNRIWPGGGPGITPVHRMAAWVVERMAARGVFASADLHNNTGRNPHYACVNRLEPAFLRLALLFSRIVVHFTRPRGVQSMAFAPLCPAVTVECGRVGDGAGLRRAVAFLEACLHLAEIPARPVSPEEIDLYHTVARVRVRPGARIAFGTGPDPEADLVLVPDIDRLNFSELPAGTVLGWARAPEVLVVENDDGERLERACLGVAPDGTVLVRCHVVPSMFTRDVRVIHQDCLGYLMERLPLPEPVRAAGAG